MLGNMFGKLFIVIIFGESYGIVLGCIVDGCFLGFEFSEVDLQIDLDWRKFGILKYVIQCCEDDEV